MTLLVFKDQRNNVDSHLGGKILNKTLDNQYYYNEASDELFPNPINDQDVSRAVGGPVSNCPISVSN